MIVRFNPTLFQTEDVQSLLDLMAIFTSYVRNTSFYWDIENIEELFANDDGEFVFNNYLGLSMFGEKFRGIFEDKVIDAYKAGAYETKLHKKYLSAVTVGNSFGEINVSDAYGLFNTPSLLIVENGTYDGQFLRNLIDLYANFGPRKSIYSLIRQALDKNLLVPSNAGGAGGLSNTIDMHRINGYGNLITVKSFTFFDSDRRDSNAINTKYGNLLRTLKGREFDFQDANEWHHLPLDNFFWHMSFKREMENYSSAHAILGLDPEISEANQAHILSKSPEELDFLDYEPLLVTNYKSQVPNIFSHPSVIYDLELRCRHHLISIELPNGTLTSVSEIEYMLLMIAKII